jgi:hypothetical protein
MQSSNDEAPFTYHTTSIVMITYLAAQFCELYNVNQGVSTGNVVMTAFSIILLIISYSIFAYLVILWGYKRKERLLALWRGDSMINENTHNNNNNKEDNLKEETTKTPKSNAKVVPEEFYELGNTSIKPTHKNLLLFLSLTFS